MTKSTFSPVNLAEALKYVDRLRDGEDQDREAEVMAWAALTGLDPGKPIMNGGACVGFHGNTYRTRFPFLMTSLDDAIAFAERAGCQFRGMILDKEKPGYWRAVILAGGKAVNAHGKLRAAAISLAVLEALRVAQ